MYLGIPPLPDPAFVRALKEFDPKLDVVFDRVAERFIIRRERAWGKPWGVLLVETDDAQYRPPDMRDIKRLYDGDLWRHGGVDARVRAGEKTMWEHEEALERSTKEEFRARGREDRIQLSNTYRKAYNLGSKAPEFRRVEVRNSRALTVSEIKAARAAGRDPWAKAA